MLSTPRLELQSVALEVRLKNMTTDSHGMKIDKCVFWSDSEIVIQWFKTDSRKYKPFNTHRISEILEDSNINEKKLHWIATILNVTDDVNVQKFPPKYNCSDRWISAPEYLKSNESL